MHCSHTYIQAVQDHDQNNSSSKVQNQKAVFVPFTSEQILPSGFAGQSSSNMPTATCKIKRQYLLTLQVSRYCLFALQGTAAVLCQAQTTWFLSFPAVSDFDQCGWKCEVIVYVHIWLNSSGFYTSCIRRHIKMDLTLPQCVYQTVLLWILGFGACLCQIHSGPEETYATNVGKDSLCFYIPQSCRTRKKSR